MEEFNISVENRTELGSSGVRKIVREGKVPGVLYQGKESLPIEINRDELRAVLAGRVEEEIVLNVNFDGKQFKAIIKEVQREPVGGEILHVDLMPIESHNYIH
ncbi:50S ribosomal protein L25 [Acetivibrio clariflavus]|uniref:Ribosomal protein L25 (General stress protein Ctc) n=1 Tax=Acetivibrio clariflavus (strain DSM 19732 / NBRC 101661 / EBR45) TaxID=720554 RepID=G8LXW6_ACECE|nr:50S ribosomal protein L25 [Acetivibrio clariflavus]AEV68869.1 ribosomal protein L25 (general stress protein Ctc) [Acetivibrio clariflavus DSM 19732]